MRTGAGLTESCSIANATFAFSVVGTVTQANATVAYVFVGGSRNVSALTATYTVVTYASHSRSIAFS